MSTFTIHVEDMHCAACVGKIKQSLHNLIATDQLKFNPVRRQVLVNADSGVHPADILTQIRRAGFHPHLTGDSHANADRTLVKRLGVAGFCMMQVMMIHIALYAGLFSGIEPVYERLLHYTALVFCLPVVCYSAIPFFHSALRVHDGLNMDVPIALAIAIAFSVSAANTLLNRGDVFFDSVVMFTFLMLAARYIDQRLRDRLQVEDELLSSLPNNARLCREDGTLLQAIKIDALRPGDLLWIAEGEQLAADGVLLSNQAVLDEALLTGESQWCTRASGASIYAGTHNRGAGFILRVTQPATSSRLAQLDALARQARFQKLNITRIADRVAQIFVPAILTIAALTFGIWTLLEPATALSATLAVLVVSCPCALSLATPAAVSAALARLRQSGLLVRNAAALEIAGDTQTVFFDKTGTLTNADPQIQAVHPLGDLSVEDCIKYAASLQIYSSHPLAAAFHGLPHWSATDVHISHGHGISGRVNDRLIKVGSLQHVATANRISDPGVISEPEQSTSKTVYLSVAGVAVAMFELTSEIRTDAAATVNWLRDADIETRMLSGDTAAQCLSVASTLGIEFIAGASPEAKAETLTSLASERSLYVGDGLNDLPVLATASVSVATLETTDLVKAKADAVLLAPRLTPIADLIQISQRTHRTIRQNLVWACAYNLLAIPLAATGHMAPWAAALGMSASSLIVLANAARLLKTPLQSGTA